MKKYTKKLLRILSESGVTYKPYDRPKNESIIDSKLKRKYGISYYDYSLLLEQQNHVCAICGTKSYTKRLAVDHDHKTGEVRGLLCSKCNLGLGNFMDNPEIIEKALKYLLTFKT